MVIPSDAGTHRAAARDGAVHVRKGGRWVASQAMGSALAALAALSTVGVGVIEQTSPSIYTVKQATFGHSGGRWTATGTFTGDRSFAFQDASGTVPLLEAAQTFTAAQTVQAAGGIITLQAATQDAMRLIGRAGGTSSYVHTQTVSAQSASHTITWPDATGIPAISAAALTTTYIPYAVAGGLLSNDAGFFCAQTSGITSSFTIGDAAVASSISLRLSAASGENSSMFFRLAGFNRWEIRNTSSANWQVVARDSAGTTIDTLFACPNAAASTLTIGRPTTQATNWAQTGATTLSTGSGTVSLNGAVTCASTITATTATLSTSLILSASNGDILSNTSAASDTKRVRFSGGGAASVSRGALINLYGANYAGTPSLLQLYSGTGGPVDILAPSGQLVQIGGGGVSSFVTISGTQIGLGITTFVGSERLRIAGGSAATAGATDVLVGAGIIDMGVSLRYRGAQVVSAPKTGYTNLMTGAANRATAYDTSTITLVQLAERVKAIQDDLDATAGHGLLAA